MAVEIDAIQSAKSIGWADALLSRLAANSVGLGARLSITAPANASALATTGYSLTGSNASSMIDLAGTLNTTGSPAIIKVAMSNTASGATTKFLSCLAGASGTTEVVSISVAGALTLGASGPTITPNVGGSGRLQIGSDFYIGQGGNGGTTIKYLGFLISGTAGATSPDIFLMPDAANTLALRNAANAQALNVYNTYTSGSVYERGFMRWVSNVFEIGTEHTGASARRISFKVNAFEYLSIGTSTVDFGSDVNFATAASWRFSSRAGMSSPSDGVLLIRNNASTDFNRLQFGGTTSSFPALKRSSTVLQSRLADDSDFAPLQGQLRSHANATSETPTATHTLRLFDAAGTEYRVLAIAV